MNRKILSKVIEELNKESPRLDYVRGILETLLESLPDESQKFLIANTKGEVKYVTNTPELQSDSTFPPLPKGIEQIKNSVRLEQ